MQKKPLTLACAEEALAEMIHRNTRGVKLQDIEEAVCKIVGLNPDSLKSDERRKMINTTRMLAMWLARKHTRAALSEIGTYFGRRSHSTVISAQKTVTSWVNEQSQVSLGNRTWNIEEAIRKVEAQLRASG
jgi:chromosomal replication initiator protein